MILTAAVEQVEYSAQCIVKQPLTIFAPAPAATRPPGIAPTIRKMVSAKADRAGSYEYLQYHCADDFREVNTFLDNMNKNNSGKAWFWATNNPAAYGEVIRVIVRRGCKS